MADQPAAAPPPEDEKEDIVARYRREERERKQRVGAAGVGVEFAGAVALLSIAGYGLDRWLDSLPVCTLVGFALGFSVAMYRLIRDSRKLIK